MSTEKKFKKDKELVFEIESHAKDIRAQLGEQMRCLDIRLDAHMGMLAEVQDFFRRRAEVEMEYSRNLDKLLRNIQTRHKQEKPRRDAWTVYSTYSCWQSLLDSTRRQSRDHATLSEVYNQHMTSRFQDIMDDMQRIHRKCRDIGAENHEELIKVLNELQSAMKTYHQYHGESIQAENKLRYVETQKQKAEQGSKSGTLSKKVKSMEKQADKKQKKYQESKQKALVARNEYLLSLDTANAAIQRYYCDDLHNLINCIDCGYHNSVERSLMMHVSGDENLVKSRRESIKSLNSCIDNLDQGADKQRFLEIFNQAFALPKKFEFQPHKGDEVRQISAQKVVQADLLERLHTLDSNIKANKLETDEIWKTIETVEKSFIELINTKDYDVSQLFVEELKPPKSPHEKYKKRSDRMDTEEFYITKFRDFTIQSNRIARLQAKFNSLQKALGEGGHSGSMPRPPSLPPKPKNSRRLGKIPKEGAPKLFGGSIEEYVEATGQEIPLVVRSCVRVLNLYGRYHQGVFRVSGSQHEINEFKNNFEKGEDPLQDIVYAKDINSVAGLLKLYFRELKEPLFPTHLFDELINCSKLGNHQQSMARVRELIGELPKQIFVVARYLFAFLSHLSEYSDENMMDAYNLAICFGPTVLPIPPDRDQVQFQNWVIDLVKNIILQHEYIFPKEIEGYVYEKIVIEEEDGEAQDSLDNLSDEDIDEITDAVSEEEPETLEALAQYDFTGRTQRELSFKKGDVLELYEQASADWWRGGYRGTRGLIPAKYISVRSLREREEDRLNQSTSDLHDKRKSAESLPARPFGIKSGNISASQPNVSSLTAHSVIGLTAQSEGKPSAQSTPTHRQDPDLSPTQERVLPNNGNMSVSFSLSYDGSGYAGGGNAVELQCDTRESPRGQFQDGGPRSPHERSHTPTAPSPMSSGQVSPAIRSDILLETSIDYPSTFKETISLKDATINASYTESSTDTLLSSLTRDTDTSSISRETLLSKDSGFSQTSSSREMTPSGDDLPIQKSNSRELLEEDESDPRTDLHTGSDMNVSSHGENEDKQGAPISQDWHHGIDEALAEIMHGVESLEKQQHLDKAKPKLDPSVLSAADTPDLVIGLPVGQTTPSPAASPKGKKPVEVQLSTAEVFASSNQSTIKKGSHVIIPKGPALESSASAGSVPFALASQPSMDEAALMRRTASTTAALRTRQNKKPRQHPRHHSDPQTDEFGSAPETPVSVLQQQTVQVVKPQAPLRSFVTPSPDRSNTPERPSAVQQQTTPSPVTAHEQITPRGPKPPIKMKPPVMKKPVKSPEVLKRLKEAQENNAQNYTQPP